jgi:hypothetical protein
MRLAPAVFWAMSIPEWRAAIAARMPRRAMPLARGEFERMMKDHPDG